MNLGRTTFGLIVIFIGVFILLDNLSILQFNWSAVFYFWPILLILVGVNILLPKKIEGQILSVMATVVTLLFFAYQGLNTPESEWRWIGKEGISTENKYPSVFSRDYDESIDQAELTISGGAVEYKISELSDKLIDIQSHSSMSSFALTSTFIGDKAVLDFAQKNKVISKPQKYRGGNKVIIRLNPAPVWDINLEIGAGSANFDLRPFKVRNLKVDGGVSSVKMMLGMPVEEISKVQFTGGVSSLDIQIPEEVSCVIHTESALSSLKFPGFTKQADGSYRSDLYDPLAKRIEINLENGLSSIKVSRYK